MQPTPQPRKKANKWIFIALAVVAVLRLLLYLLTRKP
jgi:hypothetical protein